MISSYDRLSRRAQLHLFNERIQPLNIKLRIEEKDRRVTQSQLSCEYSHFSFIHRQYECHPKQRIQLESNLKLNAGMTKKIANGEVISARLIQLCTRTIHACRASSDPIES